MHATPIQISAAAQMAVRGSGFSSVANTIALAGMPQRPASERQLPAQSLPTERALHPSAMRTGPAACTRGLCSGPLLLHRRAWNRSERAEYAAISRLRLQQRAASPTLIEIPAGVG